MIENKYTSKNNDNNNKIILTIERTLLENISSDDVQNIPLLFYYFF
jgi:hypothetical protein